MLCDIWELLSEFFHRTTVSILQHRVKLLLTVSNNQQKSELKMLQNKMIWLKAMMSLLTHMQADSKPRREAERFEQEEG